MTSKLRKYDRERIDLALSQAVILLKDCYSIIQYKDDVGSNPKEIENTIWHLELIKKELTDEKRI